MKYLFTFVFVCSLNALSESNSIIAIVNDTVITYDSIKDQVSKNTTKEQKLALINQQIDIALQKEKIQELNIEPKPEVINEILVNIAKQNNLTLEQLQSNNDFDEIVERIYQDISFKDLQKLVLQQADITITQAEIDEILAIDPVDKNNVVKQIKVAQIIINTINEIHSSPQLIKEHITKISKQIKNGASFTDLARQYSKDPIIKSIWLEKNKLPDLFQQQLLGLKLNEVSMPFKIEQNWRIIEVFAEREIDIHISNIKKQLFQAKRNAFFQAWVKTLHTKEVYIDIFENKL